MSRILGVLSRSTIGALAVLSIVAVLLGRTAKAPPLQLASSVRDAAPGRYHAFSGYLFPDHQDTPRLLDTETGAVRLMEIAGVKGLDDLSYSPWRDERGRHHLAGRWRRVAGGEHLRVSAGPGVVRCTLPGGQVLDRVAIDPIMVAPPCWFPDGSDRILFAAGDGRLHQLGFPEAGREEMAAPTRPIRWEAVPPGIDVLHIRTPCWPSGPALGGRLLVALCFSDRKEGSSPRCESRLWWLELSPDARAIVAAGPLIIATGEGSTPEGDSEHSPSFGMTRDGVPMVAYLVAPRDRGPIELWTAPITVEGGACGGVPRVQAAEARRLARVDTLAAPAFSPDGRWIYAAVRCRASGEVTLSRFAVTVDAPRETPTTRSAMVPTRRPLPDNPSVVGEPHRPPAPPS